MASYQQIQASIAKLENEARKIRAAAVKAIPAIKKQIAKYGLTAEDLGFATSGGAPSVKSSDGRRGPKTGKRPKAAPKYVDPVSGATWSGMGKPPNWIRSAKDRDAFLISGATSTTEAPPKASKKSSAGKGKSTPVAKRQGAKKAPAAPTKSQSAKTKSPKKSTAANASKPRIGRKPRAKDTTLESTVTPTV